MYAYILPCTVQSVNTWMYIVGAEPPMPPKPVSAHTHPAYDPKTIRIKHLGYCAPETVYLRSAFKHHDKVTYHVLKALIDDLYSPPVYCHLRSAPVGWRSTPSKMQLTALSRRCAIGSKSSRTEASSGNRVARQVGPTLSVRQRSPSARQGVGRH